MNDYLRTRLEHRGKRDNTFVYLFTHKGAASFTEVFQGGETFYGTSHAEELQYLFPIREDLHYFFNSVPTDQDKQLTKLITKMWVNFAYHGNPTPESSKLLPWKTAKQFPLDYMRIGNVNGQSSSTSLLSMERDLYPERTEFWRNLAQTAHYPAHKSSAHNEVDATEII